MAFHPPQVSDAFLIHSRPIRENEFICSLLTPNLGLIRCHFSKSFPEYYRKFECRIKLKGEFFSSSDFRYIDPAIIQSNEARLLGMYVHELCFLLLPKHSLESDFFGVYISTMTQLEFAKNIQGTLRYLEMKILKNIGMGNDYNRSSNLEPIQPTLRYNFNIKTGFVISTQGRYPGKLILAVAKNKFAIKGALSLARECNSLTITEALNGRALLSKKWKIFQPINLNEVN